MLNVQPPTVALLLRSSSRAALARPIGVTQLLSLAFFLTACGGGGGASSAESDLSVVGTGPSTPTVSGGKLAYTFTVTNNGPDDASQTTLGLVPDTGLVLGGITCAAAGGAQCPTTLAAQTTVSAIPKNASLTLTVSATVSPTVNGNIGLTASLSSSGDSNPANNRVTANAAVVAPNSVELQSDTGDSIGLGTSYSYTQSNALLSLSALGGHIGVSVTGNESWSGDFVLPNTQTQFTPGSYSNLTRYPFNTAQNGGLSWYGEGRGCNTLVGSINITSATYVAGELTATDFSFVQHCGGNAAALRGTVHWTAYDTTTPPGPITPVPAGLWDAAPGTTPATGNYVYLQSQPGDYIGGGSTYLYTPGKSSITLSGTGSHLAVTVVDASTWGANFAGPRASPQLVPGYYAGLERYPFNNPAVGGLDWSGYGRGCNTLLGWFAIDSITYVANTITAIDLRFEQHCEAGAAALHGKIHWAN